MVLALLAANERKYLQEEVKGPIMVKVDDIMMRHRFQQHDLLIYPLTIFYLDDLDH